MISRVVALPCLPTTAAAEAVVAAAVAMVVVVAAEARRALVRRCQQVKWLEGRRRRTHMPGA